ncbi:type I restriction enzyme subunit R domain-containing protein [Arthrobacter psychrolactophilus]
MEGDEDVTAEDVLVAEMSARAGETGQLSFFAFTATPKAKTVEMFGRPNENGVPQVFDLYSMKQAIQEGFILDVLQNYTTYAMAVRIADLDEAGQSVEVELDKGSKALMQWVKLHPHNIAQKVAVIVEHFRSNVAHHLAGRAKAMVVTGSRREAVRYKKYMDAYIRDHGYGSELATLVAFSGKIVDSELGVEEFTEHTMNAGLKGRSLTKAFGTDEFQVMIVANKFQTGFDQPLLVAMYVDKKLSGITAVQTLSRLNRVIPGKDQTFILDFVNDPETILAAFQDYYEDAEIQDASNPDIIHDMVSKMDAMNIYNDRDVELVAQKWVAQRNHNGLYSHLNPAVDVFNERMRQARADQDNLAIGQLEEFQKTAAAFNKAYDFFSQIINYQDTRIEKLAIYIKLLVKALSDKAKGNQLDLSDVVLTHYALKKIEDADLKLVDGQGQGLKGITGSGSGVAREKKSDTWAALIEKINRLFEGIGISDEDQINAISSIMIHAEGNEQLQREAQANGPIDFASSPSLPDVVEEAVYVAGEGHQKAINALLEMADAGKLVEVLLLGGLQQRLREKAEAES